ncbi:hypothetical protein Y032_0008g118 [Ancylostoma ceylanicum]|uniref:Uncharacterized protein n=1 Tax=Ancylostoma ceylanicum TaxID=53326 RepID=A0A016VJS8_9BILA|nr:hypothetical protein Y032_0008g118 [Ancylostoma ceylanicum]
MRVRDGRTEDGERKWNNLFRLWHFGCEASQQISIANEQLHIIHTNTLTYTPPTLTHSFAHSLTHSLICRSEENDERRVVRRFNLNMSFGATTTDNAEASRTLIGIELTSAVDTGQWRKPLARGRNARAEPWISNRTDL